MASGRSTPPSQPPNAASRSPQKMRVSISSSQGLSTISERMNTPPPPPPIPRRSSRRKSTASSVAKRSQSPRPWLDTSSRFSQDTTKTAPPAYDWVPEPLTDDSDNAPVEGEKLAELRKNEGWRTPRRGGWGRLWLLIAVAAVVLLALAIGLGVGLSQKKSNGSSDTSSSSSSSNTPPQKFPLGQYSFVTALMATSQICTTNPATWRCYPFVQFDPTTGSSDTSSLAYFNWAISSTDDNYATPKTVSTTPGSGIPANLTVTSQNDPFGIEFGAKPLTYIAASSNSSSPRYTFSFTMPKKVVPDPTVASDGSASVCFFNQTLFTGTIYLSASRDYPSSSSSDSTSIGGYAQWPHAVEVTQTASGGDNVPNCYKTVNGVVGAPITDSSLSAAPEDYKCLCDYRNYY